MSLTTRSYSKASRSSSFYSRSSSYHATSTSANLNNYLSSSRSYVDRPLSQRLVERDSTYLPFFSEWDEDFFRFYYGMKRPIPVIYRSSSSRSIPVQYSSSFKRARHRKPLTNDSSSNLIKQNENSIARENRISSDEWPPKQPAATRKRTSMTIFVQQPYVDLSEVPYYRQTLPTPTYPQSIRTDYY